MAYVSLYFEFFFLQSFTTQLENLENINIQLNRNIFLLVSFIFGEWGTDELVFTKMKRKISQLSESNGNEELRRLTCSTLIFLNFVAKKNIGLHSPIWSIGNSKSSLAGNFTLIGSFPKRLLQWHRSCSCYVNSNGKRSEVCADLTSTDGLDRLFRLLGKKTSKKNHYRKIISSSSTTFEKIPLQPNQKKVVFSYLNQLSTCFKSLNLDLSS